MRRFMLGLGLSHKATNANTNNKNFNMQETQAAQHFLACKTLWLQREHEVKSARVFSCDETSVNIVSGANHSWQHRGTHRFKKNDAKTEALGKVNIVTKKPTCTLMLLMTSDYEPFCQIIFKRTTARCLPTAAPPANVILDYSES
eukprot:5683110-Amphidinium_carterae.1